MVKVGDSIPNIDLVEGKPDVKVNLSQELGSGLIIGVPAAFSTLDALSYVHTHHLTPEPESYQLDIILIALTGPACSDTHIPGYIAHSKLKSAGKVFVVSVNDAFV